MAIYAERSALLGLGEKILSVVLEGANAEQWSDWLRVMLELAAASGDSDLVSKALAALASTRATAGWKACHSRTLLGAAAEGGNASVVSAVLAAGARADASPDKSGMLPIHRAARGGHSAAIRVLLFKAGAGVDSVDSAGKTALRYAVAGGHRHLALELLTVGANPNIKDRKGVTPLRSAVLRGDSHIVAGLLNSGADTGGPDEAGDSLLRIAIDSGHLPVVRVLLAAGAAPRTKVGMHSMLESAAAKRDVGILNALASHGADLDSRDSYGSCILHKAVMSGQVATIEVLAAAGASFTPRDRRHGSTPLHYAVGGGNLEAMAALFRNGADVNAKDFDGFTPLHIACTVHPDLGGYRGAEAADLLLTWGADETATTISGFTAEEKVRFRGGTNIYGRDSLLRVFDRSPADKAWRRRRHLVLTRTRLTPGARASSSWEVGDLLGRVLNMDEGLFRSIVRFL